MEAIGKLLLNPEWWFGAIFVSLVVNIASPYVHKRLSAALSVLSSKYKARAARKAAEKESRISRLAAAPFLLIAEYQFTLVVFLFWLMTIVVGFVGPTFMISLRSAAGRKDPDIFLMVMLVGCIVLMLFALVLPKLFLDRLRVCRAATGRLARATVAHARSRSDWRD